MVLVPGSRWLSTNNHPPSVAVVVRMTGAGNVVFLESSRARRKTARGRHTKPQNLPRSLFLHKYQPVRQHDAGAPTP